VKIFSTTRELINVHRLKKVTLNSACVLNAIVRLSTAYFTWMCVSV